MARSVYHTHGISIRIHKIMKSSLKEISHTLKDAFDFVEKTEEDLEIGTVLGVVDIKSCYTNISSDLGLITPQYWIEKMHQKIEHLQRFTKNFILKGISVILKCNYFYINDSFIHQMKITDMGTNAAIMHANLTYGYLKVNYLINYLKFVLMI